jgi:hypothetical protein
MIVTFLKLWVAGNVFFFYIFILGVFSRPEN